MTPRFLSVERLRQIHLDQVQRYGGDPSLRDLALLESAAAMPMASFADEFLHAFPEEMAAAYLFHFVSNHPFVDGNKRVGLAAALIFLWINGYELKCDHGALEELVVSLA